MAIREWPISVFAKCQEESPMSLDLRHSIFIRDSVRSVPAHMSDPSYVRPPLRVLTWLDNSPLFHLLTCIDPIPFICFILCRRVWQPTCAVPVLDSRADIHHRKLTSFDLWRIGLVTILSLQLLPPIDCFLSLLLDIHIGKQSCRAINSS